MAAVDPSWRFLACRYLRGQLEKLTKELRGVRQNDDIESVHQARVASRRMRAAFRMFGDCFEDKRLVKWQKRIKILTKGLGAARDKDVQIDFVETFRQTEEAAEKRNRPGLTRLLLRLRQARDTLQPEVLKALEKLGKGDVLAEMHGELERILFTLRSSDVPLQSPVVWARGAEQIHRRKHDLFVCEHTLDDPGDQVGHHQMRIAAKRLRYTMEICDLAYEGKLAPFIKGVKKVQTLLGDVHDCDVWVADIGAFMERERLRTIDHFGHPRPFLRLRPGLTLLRTERETHRRRTFADLVAYWKTLEEEGFWDQLETTLQPREEAADKDAAERQDQRVDASDEKAEQDRTAQ
ncbi:MAG: CHAD domain-containing protein [Sedimentisphaerales bacterium]|nr:CHAD domain-containing protein [Sedimentisphaerales bacterium]